jgi:lipoprotein NlpI
VSAARSFVCVWLLVPAFAHADAEEAVHPLLELAREQMAKKDPDDLPPPGASGVRGAERALEQARVPPEADCARSLGAPRFAALHTRLGDERFEVGDFAGAVLAYTQAHACQPRSIGTHLSLAEALFAAREFSAAQSIVDAGLALDPRSVELHRLAGYLAFVAARWTDATARFRYVAAGTPDRPESEYGQLMLWLAQRRAGIPNPRFVDRTHDDDWPRPLLFYLSGRYSERELIPIIEAGDEDYASDVGTQDRLCQALFYVGEAHWARGNPQLAREYLAAAVNVQARGLAERQLALAEIANLHAR